VSRIPIGQTLILSDFDNLANELKIWRIDPERITAEKSKGSGLILEFVKGLRLSARLIYALRKCLSEIPQIEVNWGHLLSSSQDSISPECDVIIHKKGFLQEWNGSDKPVMDFKFVQCYQAIAVISCKSYMRSIDRTYYAYYDRLKPYVKHILLFAECCAPGKIENLKKKAKKAGYTGLWHLYSFDKDTGTTENAIKDWQNFLITLKKICLKEHEKNKSRKPRQH
jgi:hypothetical protein